jgi:hypothetical protein
VKNSDPFAFRHFEILLQFVRRTFRMTASLHRDALPQGSRTPVTSYHSDKSCIDPRATCDGKYE